MIRPKLKIKRGVVFCAANFTENSVRIPRIVAQAAPKHYIPTMTEAWRAKRHKRDKSKHPNGMAYDFRLKDFMKGKANKSVEILNWVARISDKLGEDYDIIVHGDGNNRHIHTEYDPK